MTAAPAHWPGAVKFYPEMVLVFQDGLSIYLDRYLIVLDGGFRLVHKELSDTTIFIHLTIVGLSIYFFLAMLILSSAAFNPRDRVPGSPTAQKCIKNSRGDSDNI